MCKIMEQKNETNYLVIGNGGNPRCGATLKNPFISLLTPQYSLQPALVGCWEAAAGLITMMEGVLGGDWARRSWPARRQIE